MTRCSKSGSDVLHQLGRVPAGLHELLAAKNLRAYMASVALLVFVHVGILVIIGICVIFIVVVVSAVLCLLL